MYKQITNYKIDIERLKTETVLLFENKDLFSDTFKTQLGLTYANEKSKNKYLDAVGSLDWDYENWDGEGNPPPRKDKVKEKDFVKIVPDLKGTYLYELLQDLQNKFHIGRTRLLLMEPKTCLTWHQDSTYRLHIPIITNDRCMMVWDNKTVHMPQGTLYWVDTTQPHTAFNGSFEKRIHLVTTVENKQ